MTDCDGSVTIPDIFLIVTDFSVTILNSSVTNVSRSLCACYSVTIVDVPSQFPSQIVTDPNSVTIIRQNYTVFL